VNPLSFPVHDPLNLIFISCPAIVRLVLPEWQARPPEQPVSLPCGEPLERLCDPSQWHRLWSGLSSLPMLQRQRPQQHIHMVRHHHKREQHIPLQVGVKQRNHEQLRDAFIQEPARSPHGSGHHLIGQGQQALAVAQGAVARQFAGPLRLPVHHLLLVGQALRRFLGQRPVPAPGQEDRDSGWLPVWEAAPVECVGRLESLLQVGRLVTGSLESVLHAGWRAIR